MGETGGMFWLLFFAAAIAAAGLAAIHLGFRAPRVAERGDPGAHGLAFETISIPASKGLALHGWLLGPAGNSAAPAVIIVHGWGANMEMMLPLAEPFYADGMNVLMFDARNHGKSPRQGASTMPKFAEDTLAALDWLRAQGFTGPVALVGHSIGAAACLLAASWRHDMDAVIAIASFAHPARLMGRAMARLRLPGWLIRLVLAYVEWNIGHRYEDIAPVNTICAARCPVLLVHGEADTVIPVSDMEEIARCAKKNIRTLRVEGADHDSVEKISSHAGDLTGFLRRAFGGPQAEAE